MIRDSRCTYRGDKQDPKPSICCFLASSCSRPLGNIATLPDADALRRVFEDLLMSRASVRFPLDGDLSLSTLA